MRNDNPKTTTTDAGIPVASDEYSLTVGPDGPILLKGHFEVTKDLSAYTKVTCRVSV